MDESSIGVWPGKPQTKEPEKMDSTPSADPPVGESCIKIEPPKDDLDLLIEQDFKQKECE